MQISSTASSGKMDGKDTVKINKLIAEGKVCRERWSGLTNHVMVSLTGMLYDNNDVNFSRQQTKAFCDELEKVISKCSESVIFCNNIYSKDSKAVYPDKL